MARQFVYQDAHGRLYPAHVALAFQPGLVPGWFDTDTRVFTPSGNPQEQVGNIVTDAGVGAGPEKVLSGLREDRGADTASIEGVVVTTPAESGEADVSARLVETEAELATERERVAALEAQLAAREALPGTAEVEAVSSPLEAEAAAETGVEPAIAGGVDTAIAVAASPADPASAAPGGPLSRRARKVAR